MCKVILSSTSGAELMVKGCHSWLATAGMLTKTQSPALKWNLLGRLITRLVTSDGRSTPALTVVLPDPKFTLTSLATLSISQMAPGSAIKLKQIGAWRKRRGK